ncbi:MAG: 4-hydroxy-tetrahydrodipicolinate synthase [Chlamydiales bacterium]|nr:4-hydroxy-tetrahydrodipicolinate synthase [Chlamydiales bacterium]
MIQGMIVALVTPFKINGKIDFVCLKKLCQFHLKNQTNGLVVLGTTGESSTLFQKEKEKIVDVVLSEINGKIPVIVGTGTNNTKESVESSLKYKKMGANAGLAIVPYYNKPTPRGCVEHFKAIGQVGLPTIMYYHPGRTGIKLDLKIIKEILRCDGIIGMKDCSCDEVLLDGLRDENIFCGNDKDILKMRSLNVRSSISVVGNIFPLIWKKIVCEGNKELFGQMKDMIEALELEVNPQPIKYAASLLHLCDDTVRLPLIRCEEQTRQAIETVFVHYLKEGTHLELEKLILASRSGRLI